MGSGIASGAFWGMMTSVVVLSAASLMAPLPDLPAQASPALAAQDPASVAAAPSPAVLSAPAADAAPERPEGLDTPPDTASAQPGPDGPATEFEVPVGSEFARPLDETEPALPIGDQGPAAQVPTVPLAPETVASGPQPETTPLAPPVTADAPSGLPGSAVAQDRNPLKRPSVGELAPVTEQVIGPAVPAPEAAPEAETTTAQSLPRQTPQTPLAETAARAADGQVAAPLPAEAGVAPVQSEAAPVVLEGVAALETSGADPLPGASVAALPVPAEPGTPAANPSAEDAPKVAQAPTLPAAPALETAEVATPIPAPATVPAPAPTAPEAAATAAATTAPTTAPTAAAPETAVVGAQATSPAASQTRVTEAAREAVAETPITEETALGPTEPGVVASESPAAAAPAEVAQAESSGPSSSALAPPAAPPETATETASETAPVTASEAATETAAKTAPESSAPETPETVLEASPADAPPEAPLSPEAQTALQIAALTPEQPAQPPVAAAQRGLEPRETVVAQTAPEAVVTATRSESQDKPGLVSEVAVSGQAPKDAPPALSAKPVDQGSQVLSRAPAPETLVAAVESAAEPVPSVAPSGPPLLSAGSEAVLARPGDASAQTLDVALSQPVPSVLPSPGSIAPKVAAQAAQRSEDAPEVSRGTDITPALEGATARPTPRVIDLGPDTDQGFGVRVQPLTDRAPGVKTNRLPRIGDPASAESDPQEAAVEAEAEPPKLSALARNAEPFDNPSAKPLYSVVLIDAGDQGLDQATLATFSFPVTFAIDPSRPDAAQTAKAYREAGFEVMILPTGLPAGAIAQDVEVTLAAHLAAVPLAVGFLDLAEDGLGGTSELAEQLLAVAKDDGHGVVFYDRGLNAAKRSADRSGQPAALVFRQLDADQERSVVIRRYLDRAAFKAGQDGQVIMVGHTYEATVTALFEWALEGKAEQVSLAPVSAILRAQ